MAATTIKPYPHVQINVKDNSIATLEFVENLPVHRPLYVMRTQKGPLGEPVWCNTYSDAAALFGAETFNPANKDYFTRASLFLRETLTRNGTFISRYLPDGHSKASCVLYARVASTKVQKYKKTGDYRNTVWNDTEKEFVDEKDGDNTVPGVQIEFYTAPLSGSIDEFVSAPSTESVTSTETTTNDQNEQVVVNTSTLTAVVFPLAVFQAKDDGVYGNDLAFKLFYTPKSNDAGDVDAYGTVFYNIGFAEREYNSTTWNAISDIYTRESCAFAINPDTVNPDTGASMSVDYVLDKSFSDTLHQLPVDFEIFEENFNQIGLIIAALAEDTLDDTDGSIVASTSGASLTLNSNENQGTIGALTQAEKDEVIAYYFNNGINSDGTKPTSTFGYKINVISGKNIFNVPYDNVVVVKDSEKKAIYDTNHIIVGYVDLNADTNGIVDTQSGLTVPGNPGDSSFADGATLVSLTDFYNVALVGGEDGEFIEPIMSGEPAPADIAGKRKYTNDEQSSDDFAMYQFVKLRLEGIKDRIVESLRFPFTHIFDIGYTMKTKKAICDFLDVRDDFVFIASPQVLYSDGTGRSIKQNDQVDDEANTEAIRAYALLMRESVLYGTDCMRVSIYEHSGHLVNSTYTGIVPHTYWAAVQYSQYGNLTYMSQTEPRGLPYSYNLLFKDQNWTNYRADSQSRVWDEGGNYVQFADMTRLFYPSLRTVYRAATSVLIDEWVVAAVVYTKYVARRAWARFSGRNDSASALQDAIKRYIDNELLHLFNGKYTFNVSVYQTAEEQELGYIQHVKISITFGATMRVLDVDIEVNREGFTPEE